MNLKNKNGSIAIFVLVALLFMAAFLIILYANNVNKSKVVKEQFDIISDIYAHSGGDEGTYEKAYTDLRNKNKQTMTAYVEDSSTIELNKTFEGKVIDYKIYGNSTNTVYQYNVNLTKNGFIALTEGATYPTTNETYPNAKYEILEIKKGQKLNFNYTGTGANKLRVRCIDATTDKVVCDLVHNSGGEVTETDYYTTTIYYYHSTPDNADKIDGYVIAKKDFKIGIMYIDIKPEDFNLEIDGDLTLGVGDLVIDKNDTNYGKYKVSIKITKENGESTIKDIYLDEPLRKIGEYSDYIDFKNQKVVRNIKEHELNGTETWNIYSQFYWSAFPERLVSSPNTKLISNYFIYKYTGGGSSDEGTFTIGANTNICFQYDTVKMGIASFKEILKDRYNANTPISVTYILETPKEEKLIIPEFSTFEDYTKIEVLTEIVPSKMEMEYEGYTLE